MNEREILKEEGERSSLANIISDISCSLFLFLKKQKKQKTKNEKNKTRRRGILNESFESANPKKQEKNNVQKIEKIFILDNISTCWR